MTGAQFLEWQYYASLEPFDETRADVRAAQIVQALWNIARDTKAHPTPFALKQFLIEFGEQPPKKADVNMQIRILSAIAAASRQSSDAKGKAAQSRARQRQQRR